MNSGVANTFAASVSAPSTLSQFSFCAFTKSEWTVDVDADCNSENTTVQILEESSEVRFLAILATAPVASVHKGLKLTLSMARRYRSATANSTLDACVLLAVTPILQIAMAFSLASCIVKGSCSASWHNRKASDSGMACEKISTAEDRNIVSCDRSCTLSRGSSASMSSDVLPGVSKSRLFMVHLTHSVLLA